MPPVRSHLIEHSRDLVDLFVEGELTWAFVSFIAGIGIDMDGQRHRLDPTANSQFPRSRLYGKCIVACSYTSLFPYVTIQSASINLPGVLLATQFVGWN